MPPHLPRVGAFPIAGERSLITAAGAALKIPAKEKPTPLIGQLAPEILAPDHLGRLVSLHATIQLGRPIVLYFFPLAGSPHCTMESCSFRDAVGSSPIFNDLNAVVIGVSQDPPSRSRRFVDEHHLGFRILHDENRKTMATYGVGRGLLGLIDSRCTFVIDHQGIIRGMLEGVWDYEGHRKFAEKWLCRIEDELSGRERFYVEYDADDTVACDQVSRNVKVIYGDPLASKGIASAPRHGAASVSTHKLERRRQSSLSSVSTGETQDKPTLAKAKSRKNIKEWLRPSSSVGIEGYDEPVHIDYKYTNRSLDDVACEKQQSRTKSVARVRSLRLDKVGKPQEHPSPPLPANAVAIVKEHDERNPRSRQGSGSGWATPSTMSAGSHSTGETSIASPRTDSRETAPPSNSFTASTFGMSQEIPHSLMERRGSARVPRSASAASTIALPAQRSSSLRKRSSTDNDMRHPQGLSNGSTSQSSRLSHNSVGPEDVPQDGNNLSNGSIVPASVSAPIYANGNIAKLQLLPRDFGGEKSIDSVTSGSDAKTMGRSSFSHPSDSPRTATASLPIPPRPASRAGFRHQQDRSGGSQSTHTDTASDNDRATSSDANLLKAQRARVNSSNSHLGPSPLSSPVRRQFRSTNGPARRASAIDASEQTGSASYKRQWDAKEAPTPSSSLSTPRSLSIGGENGAVPINATDEQTVAHKLRLLLLEAQPNGHDNSIEHHQLKHALPAVADPSHGLPAAAGHAVPSLKIDPSRRVSLTPSLTPSYTTSVTDGGASENEYSPSIVESHHTFGGGVRHTDDEDDDDDDASVRHSTDSLQHPY